MKLRCYSAADKAACLALFDGNVPQFFAPHERTEFSEFLDAQADPYFVVEDAAGQILGCGGYYVNREHGFAGLTWGMVERTRHRQGTGWFLLQARLERIRQEPGITRMLLNTSQHTYQFFEKAGFSVESIQENGFGPGLHEYKMVLRLGESNGLWNHDEMTGDKMQ